jgi:hypothetical protein
MLEKQFGRICPITIGGMTYRLVAHILVIQFRNTLTEHINLHQFSVMTYGGCKIVVHIIRAMLKLHPNWVVL